MASYVTLYQAIVQTAVRPAGSTTHAKQNATPVSMVTTVAKHVEIALMTSYVTQLLEPVRLAALPDGPEIVHRAKQNVPLVVLVPTAKGGASVPMEWRAMPLLVYAPRAATTGSSANSAI
ncbi:hypothetical protein DPMN_159599 [Dreissena polymorpha]|uniref:Uncharacterized protein n=1 Tax=Dreissena polymorpha TaxID=45954 RepID=A0A9D4EPL4_DREPO|nr:hypothetical protein DPMN_159599 [Dreissena polymorpha]